MLDSIPAFTKQEKIMSTIAIEKKITPSLMNKTLKEIFSDYKSGKIIFLTNEHKKKEVVAYSDDSISREKAMKDLKK